MKLKDLKIPDCDYKAPMLCSYEKVINNGDAPEVSVNAKTKFGYKFSTSSLTNLNQI